jgi:beta-barrel assembly-enhancing protease
MRFVPRFLAGFLACTLVGQPLRADDLPELGDVASQELSLSTEKKIGQQIMDEIRWREPSYLNDPDVETYLNQLGARLVAASSDPGLGFHFFALDDPSINAFALPGGYIGVHTGLILSAQTESELAGVLGHEISHVTQHHIARQVFQSKKLSMASMVAMGLALLAARSSPQAAMAGISASQAGAISAQLAYSRDFEREADRLGFDTLRSAGFDTAGMPGFFERLQSSSRFLENNATAYLRTHPLTVERLSDMQNRQLTEAYRQVADSQDFTLVRARIRALQGRPADAVKDFETLLRDKKYASEGGARYGLAVAFARNSNWSAAEQELLAVRKLKVSSAMVERLLAEVKISRGEIDDGLAIYRDAMARYPLNLSVLYGYGNALIAGKRFNDALKFAATQLQSYPQDVRFYKMRADANAGLGRRSQQHLALAEMTLLKGQTAGAIEQLQLAQQAGDANFYELSVIDGRLRELKKRQIEEMKEKEKERRF